MIIKKIRRNNKLRVCDFYRICAFAIVAYGTAKKKKKLEEQIGNETKMKVNPSS